MRAGMRLVVVVVELIFFGRIGSGAAVFDDESEGLCVVERGGAVLKS